MRKQQSLRLKNDSTYRGNDWWDWSVWLEGPDAELDQVSRVEYVLHSTFANPVRSVPDRKTKFRLDSSGWGEFEVRATVHFKNDRQARLRHWLQLKYPDVEGESPAEEKDRRRVFLSYSITDRHEAARLAEILEREGVEVASLEKAPPGHSVEQWMLSQMQNAGATVVIVSGEPSDSRQFEIDLAKRAKARVVPVLMGKGTRVPSEFRDAEVIRVGNISRMDLAVPKLLKLLS